MARSSGIAALFVCCLAARAHAADVGREEHRVDFEAEQVEIAGSETELSLSGDVVVRAERFQLTADAVTLSRSPRGVHVEGSGRLAFCRCKHPPITLGFVAADLAPPTDVLLEHATVRVFGVPVFYSPYLWLRAPSQLGVLPPTFEYRGAESLFIGTGVHLPIDRKAPQPTIADIGGGVYLTGGIRMTGDIRGPSGRARLAWDYFRGSAWDARSDFATTAKSDATWAGSIHVLRGARALVAPATVDDVALKTDRARLGVGRVTESMLAFSVSGAAPRGSDVDSVPVFGPLLELGRSVPLGSRAIASFLLETEALRTDGGPVSASAMSAEISASFPVGPILSDLWLRERARALVQEAGDVSSVDAEVRQRVALPLARRFGRLVHRVEPVIEGAVGTRRVRRSGDVVVLDERGITERLTVLGGFETALGWANYGAELRIMGGVSGPPEDGRSVLAARGRLNASAITLESEARAVPEARAVQAFARAEAGSPELVRAAVHVEARHRDPNIVERLFHDDFTRPEVPWLGAAGVSAGGLASFPLVFGLRSEVGLEFDVSRERFLGGTSTVGYRHFCDCLGISLWGAKRLGREAFDVALRIDLVP